MNQSGLGLTLTSSAALAQPIWPGNVRELENVITSACMMSNDEIIDVGDLPGYVQASSHTSGTSEMITLDELKQLHIRKVLEQVGGNKVGPPKF